MSIILFPFKLLAMIFGGLGKGLGLVVAGLVAAFITRWLLCVYAWNAGNTHITGPVLFWSMVAAFVLTLIAGNSK
jgi:hypothetical protein